MKLRYASGGILVAALLVFTGSAAAKQGTGQINSLVAQHCAQERASIGKKAFRKKYGAKHTMRSCARRNRARVASAARSASEDCQLELGQTGSAMFIDDYGEDEFDSLESAMAECVAEGVDELLNPDTGDDSIDDGTDE